MNVDKCMTRDVQLTSKNMRIVDAAKMMQEGGYGILPVVENEKIIGMITDRDIALRCVARGLNPKEVVVGQIMTNKVLYCYDDQPIEEVLDNLGSNQIWRMPVVNRDKKLVGIVTVSDLAFSDELADNFERTLKRLSNNDIQKNRDPSLNFNDNSTVDFN